MSKLIIDISKLCEFDQESLIDFLDLNGFKDWVIE